MPKLAATLALLLLIASSIGVTIARYPQIGRTIEPARAEADDGAAPAAQAAANDAAAAAARDAETKPWRRDAGDSEHRADLSVAESEPAEAAATMEHDTAIPIIDVRPMVPVTSLEVAGGNSARGAAEVRRLPLIELGGLARPDTDAALSDAVYPSTATP